MKLQTKISLSILPVVAIVIFAFGTWSVMISTRGLHDTVYQVIQMELQDYVEHSMVRYQQILVNHGIAGVESFVENYSKLALADAEKLQYHKTSHLIIFNNDGERLYCNKKHKNEDTVKWQSVIKNIHAGSGAYVQGHVNIDSDSQIYIGYRFIPWKWTIIYAVSDRELMAPARKIQKATIVTAIVFTFIGFVLIFFVQKYFIINPVTTLMKATGSVAAFKPVERIDIPTNDELGTLARAMENMAQAIQTHRQEKEQWQGHLETQIEKRTLELQASNCSLTQEIHLREEINTKLSQNERFLRIVLDSIKDGICVLDTRLRIVRVNRAMNHLYPDNVPLEGKKCYEVFHRRKEECSLCPAQTVLNSGKMKKGEAVYSAGGCDLGLLEVFVFPMLDDDGRATGVVEYIRDITDRKRMEMALQESEEKFRRIFESMQDAYLLTSLKGDILLANPSAAKRLGYDSIEVMMTKNIIRDIYLNPEDRMVLRKRLMEAGRLEGYPLALKRQDGKRLFAEGNIQLVKDNNDNPVAVEGVFRDVTKQKQMIREITEAHELNERITSSPSLGIGVYEETGQCVFANDTMATLVGTIRDKCLRQNFNLLDSWEKSGLAEKANRVLSDGCERDHQIHAVSSFNKKVCLNCKLTRFDKNNHPHLLLFVEDISEKAQMLAQLEERNLALERSNKELDDFSYIASHDLKEPLRGIANYSMFLMEDYGTILDDEGKSKLETLVRLCKREESLIESLLFYSRVGRIDLAIQPVDLNSVVQTVIDRISPTISENGVDIRIRDTLPTVACDMARVGEVFYNLVTNGIKYNDNPHKRVEIGLLEEDEISDCNALKNQLYDFGHQVFFVRDNGIGIREKHISKIFSIFKRLHGRDKYGGGTGAGLTIVEKIIHRHGGTILVDSEIGKGSVFYFTLKGERT